MELFWHGEKVADVPVQPVSEEAPVLDRPIREPEYLKTISKDTIDINIAPISMKARKGVFFKPKKLHFKKVEINIPCGGTNGYQPDFRYVYNSEINTWINIAPKFKLD